MTAVLPGTLPASGFEHETFFYRSEADFLDGRRRDHECQVAFVELQDEVRLFLAKDVFVLDLLDGGDPVLWINNLVAHLVFLAAGHWCNQVYHR